jgi:pimeloyl-ACP methyl ester carboxylesterase
MIKYAKLGCFLLVVLWLNAWGQQPGADTERVELNGVEIAYRMVGDGEPVLLIHGGGIADAYVRLLKEPALQDYQLIAYHRRNTGHSGDGAPGLSNDVADAAALLEYLGHDSAHVVGHSSGGRIALAIAIDRPELVHSLILMEPAQLQIDGFGPEDMGESFQARLAERQREIQQAIAETRLDEMTLAEQVDDFMSWLAGADWEARLSPDIPDVMAQAVRQRQRPPSDQSTGARQPENRDVEAFRSLAQPVLWVWSDAPTANAEFTFEYYQELIPRFDEVHVSGVGHALQLLEPQPVAEAISEFLAEYPME